MELQDCFNGFKISVDWLEFTLDIKNISSACSLVGLSFIDFEIQSFGAMGYTKYARHRVASIYIYWNGNSDMGCHFRITGTSITYFFDSFINSRYEESPFGKSIDFTNYEFSSTYFSYFFSILKENGKLSRIDLALDDLSCIYYTTDDIIENLNNCMVISKFKDFQNVNTRSISNNENKGHTIYFGSRKSDIMLRVYDKALEQKSDFSYWYRWEFELKDERANSVVDFIIQKDCIGSVFAQVLNDYIRFINNDRSERKKCSTQQKWLDFLGTTSKIHLTLGKHIKTIENKLEWLEKQCFPTVAGVAKYYEGDMSFLYDRMESSYIKNNAKNKLLYEKVVDYVLQ